MIKQILLSVSCLLAVSSVKAQDIATARNAAVGTTVTFRGVSLNGPELSNIRYIQDATAGIAIYGSNLTSIQSGDSVLITGTMTNYNNLAEITPVSSMSVLANVALPPAQLITTVSDISEQYESELVRLEHCTFANGGATFAGNTNYNVTMGGQTFQVRISAGSPLIGEVIPSGVVNLTGILSQYCFSPATGCTSGYQLLLRTINDIESTSSIYLTQAISTSAINTSGFAIHWSTNIAGTNSYIKYGLTPAMELGTISAGNTVNHTAMLSGLTPATIYYVRAFSWNGADSAVTLERTFATQSLSSGVIKAYFNRSTDTAYSTGTDAVYLNHLVADTLASYINRTNYTLDICIYNWDHSVDANKIITAVNNAYNRGVKVRIINDGSSQNSAINSINSQIPVLTSPQGSDYTIMHNKFVIMDANASNPDLPIVWTGSTNFTDNQLTIDANNVIIFQDQSLARGYKMEFDEMWGDSSQIAPPNLTLSRFGQFKTDNTPHEYLIGGKRVESYFSPSDQVNTQLIKTIQTADYDLYFALMVITRSDLGYALHDQIQQHTLTAKGIIDDASTSPTPYGILSPLMGQNLAVNGHNWIFHHKYLLVDASNTSSDPVTLTGSHNWSSGADQKNDENTVIVHDAAITNQYYQEFMGRWCERNGGNCQLGLEEMQETAPVVYPNPFDTKFHLSGLAAGISFEILDLYGKQVRYSGDEATGFALETPVPGIYFLKTKKQTGEEHVIQLVQF